ncbi:hypothetical protein ABZ626_02690 [Streptomyces longispororuber]|uniref:hypothetical protein n=1 Tax=Streptomyces longispororuber TaxID=68230 RepID=UPI0033E0DBA9
MTRDGVRLLRRLAGHELRGFQSLGLWVARRRHGVGGDGHAAAYTGPQTATLLAFTFLCVVETVALALVVPWPLVHGALLFVDVYTVAQCLALHAACVTRPHVVAPDGSLRVRYGHLLDLRVPASAIARARVDHRFPEGRAIRIGDDGTLDVAVGNQTTVTVELAHPVEFVRPLGRRASARVVRLHADDPRALVDALRRPRAEAPAARAADALTGEADAPARPAEGCAA